MLENKFLNQDLGILILRLFIGARLIYGVIDNIISWEKMLEFCQFLAAFNFPAALVSAVVSVYAQFICGMCILIGFKIRWASIIMVFNFLIALIFVHIKSGDSIEAMTPALAMFFSCLCFIFTGAGKYAFSKTQ